MNFIQQGKKSRNELQLPILHFIVVDDWIPKLGKAFEIWLKLHTLADRSDSNRTFDMIPRSIENLAKYLGMGKNTLYRYLKPLWEFGLIDIIEYEGSTRKTQKPKNIIVYEYPKNDRTLATEPLEKVRDWADYSPNVHFGRIGGLKSDGSKSGTVDGSKDGTVDGSKDGTVDGSNNGTVTVPKMEHNNVSNTLINVSNSLINDTNISINDSNSLLTEEERLAALLEKHRSINPKCIELLLQSYFSFEDVCGILAIMDANNIQSFTRKEMSNQLRFMSEMVNDGMIQNPPFYFVNGIVQKRTMTQRQEFEEALERKIQSEKKVQQTEPSALPFYNWVED